MIYQNFTNFLKNRAIELIGLSLIFMALLLSISFFSYSPNDPTFLYGAESTNIKNLLGLYGGIFADFLLQSFGVVSFLLLANLIFWGLSLLIKKEIKKLLLKLFFMISYLAFGSIFIYVTFNNSFWLIDNGNSGFVGKISYDFISNLAPWINSKYSLSVIFFLTITFFIFASGLNIKIILAKIFKIIISIFKKQEKNETRNKEK